MAHGYQIHMLVKPSHAAPGAGPVEAAAPPQTQQRHSKRLKQNSAARAAHLAYVPQQQRGGRAAKFKRPAGLSAAKASRAAAKSAAEEQPAASPREAAAPAPAAADGGTDAPSRVRGIRFAGLLSLTRTVVRPKDIPVLMPKISTDHRGRSHGEHAHLLARTLMQPWTAQEHEQAAFMFLPPPTSERSVAQ